MARRFLAVILSAALVLTCPGAGVLPLLAQEGDGAEQTRIVTHADGTATVYHVPKLPGGASDVPGLIQRVRDSNISEVEKQRAISFLERYQDSLNPNSAPPEAVTAMSELSKKLSGGGDANLALANFYAGVSNYTRQVDGQAVYTGQRTLNDRTQELTVHNRIVGDTVFKQTNEEIGYNTYKKVIRRPDPKRPGEEVVDSIILESQKGAADEQRVVYNRKVHFLLRDLKNSYYDQTALRRQMEGSCDYALAHRGSLEKSEVEATCDTTITGAAYKKMSKVFDDTQAKYPPELLSYLARLDELERDGKLAELNPSEWKTLDQIQRLAMRFSTGNQLETMQKAMIAELSGFISQMVNSSAKQKKGEENLDASMKDFKDLQGTLTEFEKGNLNDYTVLTTKLAKATRISHESERFYAGREDLMTAAGEAFVYLAAAAKAKERAFTAGSTAEEIDAAVEESQDWQKLAQIQLQNFELGSLALQLGKLKSGGLQDYLGLDDPKMKKMAETLINTTTGQYMLEIAEAGREAKHQLLKQSVANFYITYENAANAYLYSDTLQERLRTLAAKLSEIKMLYLAERFDKAKGRFKGYSAADKVQGVAFSEFLKNLSGQDAELASEMESMGRDLEALIPLQSVEAIREGLRPIGERFERLAAKLGFDEIPDPEELAREAQRLSVKQSHVFDAVQQFSARLRVFDAMNELDLDLRKYASPELVHSDSESWLAKAANWVNKGMDAAINKGTLGLRDKTVDAAMKNNPLTRVAYNKLRANQEERHAVLARLSGGDFEGALALIEKLDPDAARKAVADYNASKASEDAADASDIDTILTRPPDDLSLVKAQGVIGSLFGQLNHYMMGYMLTAAGFDMAAMTVATAGLGMLYKSFLLAGEGVEAAFAIGEAANAGRRMQELAGMERLVYGMSNGVGKFTKAAKLGWLSRYAGKVVLSWGTGFKNVLELQDVVGASKVLKQTVGSLGLAAKFTGTNVIQIGLASAGMSTVGYHFNKENSQFNSYGDAFWQGAAGGISFGAKGNFFFMLSPFPASAMGGSAFGKIMTGAAETPGPVSAAVSGVAKFVRPGSALAESGPLGLAQKAWETASAKQLMRIANWGSWEGARFLAADGAVNLGLWSAGMAEGAAKYAIAGAVPQAVAELSALGLETLGDKDDKDTPYVTKLARAQAVGASLGQITWLAVPTNTMYSGREIRAYKESNYAAREILRKGGRGNALVSAKGDELSYGRNWWQRFFNRDQTMGGVGKVRSEAVQDSVIRLDMQNRPALDVLGAAVMAYKGSAWEGVRSLTEVYDKSAPGKARLSHESLRSAELVKQAFKRASPGASLYAVLDEAGNIKSVGRQPPEGKTAVQLSLKSDGTIELAPSQHLEVGLYENARTAVEETNAAIKREPLKNDEIFMTQQSAPLYAAIGDRWLAEHPKVCDAILLAKDSVEIEGRRIGGDTFKTLRILADRVKDNASRGLIGDVGLALSGGLGRAWNVLTGDPVKSAYDLRVDQLIDGAVKQALAARSPQERLSVLRKRVSALFEESRSGARMHADYAKDFAEIEAMLKTAPGGNSLLGEALAVPRELDRLGREGQVSERTIQSLKEIFAREGPQAARGEARRLNLGVAVENVFGPGSPAGEKGALGGTRALPEEAALKIDGLSEAGYPEGALGALRESLDKGDLRSARRQAQELAAESRLMAARQQSDAEALSLLVERLGAGGRADGVLKSALPEVDRLLQETTPGAPRAELERWLAQLKGQGRADESKSVADIIARLESLKARAAKPDAERLGGLIDILKRDGPANETLWSALAEIGRMLEEPVAGFGDVLDAVADHLSDGAPSERIADCVKLLKEERSTGEGAQKAAFDRLIGLLEGKGSAQALAAAARAEIEAMRSATPGAGAGELRSIYDGLSKARESLAEENVRSVIEKAQARRKALSGVRPDDVKAINRLIAALRSPDPEKAAKAGGERIASMLENTAGAPAGTLKSLARGLGGSMPGDALTVDDVKEAGSARFDSMLARDKTEAERTALRDLRQSYESDAVVQFGERRLVSEIDSYRKHQDSAKLDAAVAFFKDTWERGVFGQMFKARAAGGGERVWDIPPELQFKDAKGDTVRSFRQGQLDAMEGVFRAIAGRGENGMTAGQRKQIFSLLETSGGKTLLGFVLVGFMQTYARGQGKQGALYVTANEDLVTQGMDVYKAFFKNRKPNFEILTYSDLMARQAQAQAMGTRTPFETHEVFLDEFDMVGLGTPLSLGQFNGQLSFAKIDLLQKTMREAVKKAGLLKQEEFQFVEGAKTLYEKYGGKREEFSAENLRRLASADAQAKADYDKLLAKTVKDEAAAGTLLGGTDFFARFGERYGLKNISEAGFREKLAQNSELRGAFEALVKDAAQGIREARSRMKSGKFIENVSDEYARELGMTREEVYRQLNREQEHAFGTFWRVGVLEAKYGGEEGWARKVLEGAVLARSEGEKLFTLYEKDPQRASIIQYHNDQALDSLDTYFRTALELSEEVPVTNDFSHVAITRISDLLQSARNANALSVAASGTLAGELRPYFKDMGWSLVGGGSDPTKALDPHYRTRILSRGSGQNPGQVQFEHVAGEIVKLKERSRSGKRNIAYVWVETKAKMSEFYDALERAGIGPEKVSLLTYPGSAYFEKERHQTDVRAKMNIEGIKRGDVDVVLLVGQGGLRGA